MHEKKHKHIQIHSLIHSHTHAHTKLRIIQLPLALVAQPLPFLRPLLQPAKNLPQLLDLRADAGQDPCIVVNGIDCNVTINYSSSQPSTMTTPLFQVLRRKGKKWGPPELHP